MFFKTALAVPLTCNVAGAIPIKNASMATKSAPPNNAAKFMSMLFAEIIAASISSIAEIASPILSASGAQKKTSV